MQFRKFGKSGIEVSALGFGAMRLPVIDGDHGKIDIEKTREMFLYSIERGVNYIDSAYVYHEQQSEVVVGQIIDEENLRDRVYLATKCPVWMVEANSDFDKFIATELERLRTDHIDMYLLHSLAKERWDIVKRAHGLEFLDRAKKAGRIRLAGFSFHDDIDLFKTIVDSYDWDFCQIQFNFLDEDFQAGLEGLRYAASRGLAVVIMEPLRGGNLARNVPPEVTRLWESTGKKRTPAEWALRWVWNHPEVSIVLSGMSELEQVKENIETAETAIACSLTEDELRVFDEVKRLYKSRIRIGCTGCEYCMPCPQEIHIPDLFQMYNNALMFDTVKSLPDRADRIRKNLGDPASCVECGSCENACPQHLEIRRYIKEIAGALARKP